MAFVLVGSDPPVLTLYRTAPIHEASVLADIKRDFELSSNFPRDPSVLLKIDERDDFLGLTPEDIARRGIEMPFLVADARTAEEGDGIWYVERWLEEEDEVEDLQLTDADGEPRWALKIRVFAHYAPILHVNLEIANTSIVEEDTWDADPEAAYDAPPSAGGADWRFEPPPAAAYVVVDPARACETRPAENAEGRSEYRLKEEWAARLGVRSEWTIGSPWDGARDDKDVQRAKELGMKEGSAVVITQNWEWNPPEGLERKQN